MSELVHVCAESQLPGAGQVAEFVVDGRALCVANLDGSIAVLDGVCPHEGGPLGEGMIEDGCVVCPWHSYSFNLHSGISPQDDGLKAEVLEAVVENGELRVKL
ncbi:MAG TPA: Rieske (2Fe-2S) protein [Terracidiphilus sp.]|nr:Rieske (2Fe-2S) protein [Terracidiphilus sp.]